MLLTTQPRTAGLGSFVGFDYSALPFLLTAKGIPESEWIFLLDKLSVLTSIALRYWNKEKDK